LNRKSSLIGINGDGINYDKNYFVSSYLKANALNARSFCKSFGANFDLGSFESQNELLVIKSKLEPLLQDDNMFVIVGGFAHTAEYRWISSGLKIFSANVQPNNNSCLGIKKEKNNSPLTFVPISCQDDMKFVCEEVELKYEN
jgi:hypothetical protein